MQATKEIVAEISRPLCAIWSGKRDLNPRPLPWQGNALPTELFPRTNLGPSRHHFHEFKAIMRGVFVNKIATLWPTWGQLRKGHFFG